MAGNELQAQFVSQVLGLSGPGYKTSPVRGGKTTPALFSLEKRVSLDLFPIFPRPGFLLVLYFIFPLFVCSSPRFVRFKIVGEASKQLFLQGGTFCEGWRLFVR